MNYFILDIKLLYVKMKLLLEDNIILQEIVVFFSSIILYVYLGGHIHGQSNSYYTGNHAFKR